MTIQIWLLRYLSTQISSTKNLRRTSRSVQRSIHPWPLWPKYFSLVGCRSSPTIQTTVFGTLKKVLDISDKLVGDRARQLFSAEDVAMLTFSILLHDLALHVSEAGFQSLLRDPNWANSWRDFLNTAKHWDDRKLVQVFGADETGAPLALVNDPFDDYSNLTESDRKLIGEFIRQHHPQLAYEFALAGFPGNDNRVIPFGSFEQDLRETRRDYRAQPRISPAGRHPPKLEKSSSINWSTATCTQFS